MEKLLISKRRAQKALTIGGLPLGGFVVALAVSAGSVICWIALVLQTI